jgi:hypothetical protein
VRRRTLATRAAVAAVSLAGLLAGLAAGTARAQHGDEEVPFITTPDRVTLAMLELAAVGATDRVDFRVQDLFDTDLAGFSVITMYVLPEVNLKQRPRLLALLQGTQVVSHEWDLGNWAPDRSITLDVPEKTIGREMRSRLDAAGGGRWHAAGAPGRRVRAGWPGRSAAARSAAQAGDRRHLRHRLSAAVPRPSSSQLAGSGTGGGDGTTTGGNSTSRAVTKALPLSA